MVAQGRAKRKKKQKVQVIRRVNHNDAELIIVSRDGSKTKVTFDWEDAFEVGQYRWHLSPTRTKGSKARDQGRLYVATKIGRKTVRLHRFLLKPPSGYVVDHVNGNGLDNRRSNLRVATYSDNAISSTKPRGKTGYFGVSYDSETGRWLAEANRHGRRKRSRHATAEDAAHARDKIAVSLQGEFARLNFPHEHGRDYTSKRWPSGRRHGR